MKRVLLTGIFILFCMIVQAQINAGNDTTVCFGEQVELKATVDIPNNYHPIFFTGNDIVYPEVLDIGFTFAFYGNGYTQFVIGANGWVSFDTSLAGTEDPWVVKPIPDTDPFVPKNCIMAPWQDWSPFAYDKAYIGYETIGDAPNRKLVVSWFNVPLRQQGVIYDSLGVFQIILKEAAGSSSTIEFHITKKPDTDWVEEATIGVHNINGTKADWVDGRNATQWTSIEEAWRFTSIAHDDYAVFTIPFHPEIIGSLSDVSWYRNEIDSANLIGTGNIWTLTPAITTNYISVVLLNESVPYKDTVTVFVAPNPIADAGQDQIITLGDPALLNGIASSGNEPYYFSWEPRNMVIEPNEASTFTEMLFRSITFELTVQDDKACKSITDEVEIIIQTGPLYANLSVDKEVVCSGDSVKLEVIASGGLFTRPYKYVWNLDPPGGYQPPGDSVVYANPVVTTIFTVTVTDELDSSFVDQITVTVPVVNPEISGDAQICANDNEILYITDSTGNSFSWLIMGITPDDFFQNNNELTIDWGNETGTGQIQVIEVTNDQYQCADTAYFSFEVFPNPEPGITGTAIMCLSDSTQVYITDYADGNIYEWSILPPEFGELSYPYPDSNEVVVNWHMSGSGSVYVKETTPIGCKASGIIEILVNPLPLPFISGLNYICQYDTVVYFTSGLNGNIYDWTLNPPDLGDVIYSSDSSEIRIFWKKPGSASLRVNETVGTTSCENISDTFNIVINPPPDLKIFPSEDAICVGDSAFVQLSGADIYSWIPFNGITTITDSSWLLNPDSSSDYKIVGSISTTGCYDSIFYVIEVKLNPVIELGDELRFLYPGTPVLIDAGPGYDTYQWSDGTTGQVLETYAAGKYWVTVENSACFAADTAYIVLTMQSLPIPNAFTPNGDGINDVFNLVGQFSQLKQFQMQIYDRWGALIFETTDHRGWDGTKDGSLCNPGVYRWIISFEEFESPISGTITKTGSVTLLQ